MAQSIRDVMTPDPLKVEEDTHVVDVARAMRDRNIGDVLVVHDGELRGIVTDRDIVVRCVAENLDPAATPVSRLCSDQLVTLGPDADVSEAVRFMEEKAVRRIPIVEGLRPVGIVSIGDLALKRDPESALGHISAAPPNR